MVQVELSVVCRQTSATPFLAIREETLQATADPLGGPWTRPFGGIDAAVFLKHQHQDAAVHGIRSIPLADDGRVVLLPTLVEPRLFLLRENEERVEFAAALIIALAAGIGAARQKIRVRIQLEIRRTERLHVGFKKSGVGCTRRKPRNRLHGFPFIRVPVLGTRSEEHTSE